MMFLKFLRIEISDESEIYLSSGWTSGSKYPDDWGRMYTRPDSNTKTYKRTHPNHGPLEGHALTQTPPETQIEAEGPYHNSIKQT